MPNINLLTIGDVAIDQYMEIDDATVIEQEDIKLLQLVYGGKIPVETYRATIAGNSCNVAITANKLGLKSGVFTSIGRDPNGNKFVETFTKAGIETELCLIDESNSTNVHTIISFKSERTILSHHPKRQYKVTDLIAWIDKHGFPDWLYYTSMPPNFKDFQTDLIAYINTHHQMGVCFNPGSFHIKEGVAAIRQFLCVTDILFVNLEEAQFILQTDSTDVEDLHDILHTMGPKITVITDSINGSSAFDGTKLEKMGVFLHDKKIVDKTGAGDAFSASFVSALHHQKSIKDALTWGSINAANVITRIGSIHGQLTLEEMQTLERIVKTTPSFAKPLL